MNPLHQQLGLDLTRGSEMVVLETIDKIAIGLHDYSDNGPVHISFKKRPNPIPNTSVDVATLRALASHDIINYEFNKTEFTAGPNNLSKTHKVYIVSIKNRYRFEQLRTELSQRYDPPAFIRKETPNLVYYDSVAGEGTVNGIPINFNYKSKQRALFELLFSYAPEPTPREKVIALLRLGNSRAQADRLNTAVGNLCTKCKVKRDVIAVSSTDVTLNATAVPLNTRA